MSKKYRTPILMLDGGGEGNHNYGGSQGTHGYASMYTWDSSLNDRIGPYLEDEAYLFMMDEDGDLHISVDEFNKFVG